MLVASVRLADMQVGPFWVSLWYCALILDPVCCSVGTHSCDVYGTSILLPARLCECVCSARVWVGGLMLGRVCVVHSVRACVQCMRTHLCVFMCPCIYCATISLPAWMPACMYVCLCGCLPACSSAINRLAFCSPTVLASGDDGGVLQVRE